MSQRPTLNGSSKFFKNACSIFVRVSALRNIMESGGMLLNNKQALKVNGNLHLVFSELKLVHGKSTPY